MMTVFVESVTSTTVDGSGWQTPLSNQRDVDFVAAGKFDLATPTDEVLVDTFKTAFAPAGTRLSEKPAARNL
jgi:hypothetical protein